MAKSTRIRAEGSRSRKAKHSEPTDSRQAVERAQRGTAPPRPVFRALRAYAFDPLLATQLETADINEVVLQVPWEGDPITGASTLQPGPVGEYLEVIDVDPASQCVYPPVDLDDPVLLASRGLAPSEGNPKFHQQMVFGVAMTTIKIFERSLGRVALWSPDRVNTDKGDQEFVPRLRIHPHALREANAYYSPDKKALLFGYFPASSEQSGLNLPGGTVFTCLSHDIIAHETTHALLDGMHRRFLEPSNPDVLAFHEAFADIVALFQHFSYPEILTHQLAKTRGDLASENLLGQLAQQFGHAIGQRGALRDALGRVDEATGKWVAAIPDPTSLERIVEPHDRGSVLVAAVFDAFRAIYRSRSADLFRIATNGTGVLPPGDIHPDLVQRLAREASVSAKHLLTMCIRALDYCPPMDLTFGEYLRALITADADLVPDDDRGYRLAVIEAFRRWGIYPRGVRSLSTENLLWDQPDQATQAAFSTFVKTFYKIRNLNTEWGLTTQREAAYAQMRKNAAMIHDWIRDDSQARERLGKAFGLLLTDDAPATIKRDSKGIPVFEVHSVRPIRRVGPDGDLLQDLIVEVTQRQGGFLDPEDQARFDKGEKGFDEPDFDFRGGVTLLVDLASGKVRYGICKPMSPRRLSRYRDTRQAGSSLSLRNLYDWRRGATFSREPFARLHRSTDDVGEEFS